jgi:hypothetical protein
MENVTIELVQKSFENPYFCVQSQENSKTIKCFTVSKPENFEAVKAEAIEYANKLRDTNYTETRTLIEF